MAMISSDKAPFHVASTYSYLWQSFMKVNKDYAHFEPRNQPFAYRMERDNHISLNTKPSEPLKLIGWPFRFNDKKARSKKSIFITISMDQIIDYKPNVESLYQFVIDKSSIAVSYYDFDSGSSRHDIPEEGMKILQVRYELDKKLQYHPLFHSHIEDFAQMRIATPPMDLKAVLFGLVADHVSSNLRDLIDERTWRNSVSNLPLMPCDIIRAKMREGRFDSVHWYILPF